jgi:hypothetical protein
MTVWYRKCEFCPLSYGQHDFSCVWSLLEHGPRELPPLSEDHFWVGPVKWTHVVHQPRANPKANFGQ